MISLSDSSKQLLCRAAISPGEKNTVLISDVDAKSSMKLTAEKVEAQLGDQGIFEPPKLQSNGNVSFSIPSRSLDSVVNVEVKAGDLATFLGIAPRAVQEAVVNGSLDSCLYQKLVENKLSSDKQSPEKTALKREENAREYQMFPKELEEIQDFYTKNKGLLEGIKWSRPFFISRDQNRRQDMIDEFLLPKEFLNIDPPLARSLCFVPSEFGKENEGLYMVLKSHGGMKELGVGGFNTATIMVNLETGQKKIWRTGSIYDVSPDEREANNLLAPLSQHFIAGPCVTYIGPYRERHSADKDTRIANVKREESADKVSIILPFANGGDLFDSLLGLPYEKQIVYSHQMAVSLAFMQSKGIVHNDLKPENIFIVLGDSPDDEHVKVADFGYALKTGETRSQIVGTPGYIAPEIISDCTFKGNHVADSSSDMWSLGCVLAYVTQRFHWGNVNTQNEWKNMAKMLDPDYLEIAKNSVFKEKDDPSHFDYLISECLLRLAPKERVEAWGVVEWTQNRAKADGIPLPRIYTKEDFVTK